MASKRKKESEGSSHVQHREMTHEDLTMYGDAGSSLLRSDPPETAAGKGIAACGCSGATNFSYNYHVKWSEKVASTQGFWRKLKVIIIG